MENLFYYLSYCQFPFMLLWQQIIVCIDYSEVVEILKKDIDKME